MVRRRDILSIATSALIGLTGCLSSFQAMPGGSGPLEVGEDTRAKGAPKELTITELEGDFEYFPSNDTIRYPAKRSGGEVIEYDFGPYEHWAEQEAHDAAINAAGNVFSPAISQRNDVWVEAAPWETSKRRDLRVVYLEKVNDEGDVVEEPSIDLQSLIQEVPTTVEVTIKYDGNMDEYIFPVYVYRAEGKHVFGTTREN